MEQKPQSILFVCLGNICRSPAAEGVMRYKADMADLDIVIDSAGIGAWHVGNLPDSRMRECGANHGYCFDHHARQVCRADFDSFDVIVGMDSQNIEDLKSLAPSPQSQKKIRLMSDYLTDHEGQSVIPDPYYGSEADFEFALELIEDATDSLVERIAGGRPL